ncbi:MAG: TetR/AcrR family transcriptional regulator, partial [Actinomycetota bacterium]|nr:TetR/AcrR family transcriptional regulator [Actinomycetota bacterium]
ADQVAVWVGTAVDGPPAQVSRSAGRIAAYVLGIALCRYVLALAPIAALSQAELVAEMGSVLQLLLDN